MKTNIFFSADHHFGHANIIKFENRPFESVEEMDEELIKRWNEKVGKDDEVYYLGDLSLASPSKTKEILNQLNGKIYLIKGNHEKSSLSFPERFEWIKDYHELYVEPENGTKQKVILMHYCLKVWNGSHKGTWQLFGHSHGNLPDDETQRQFDVGVDCHDFYPISLQEVQEIMNRKKWVSPFEPRN